MKRDYFASILKESVEGVGRCSTRKNSREIKEPQNNIGTTPATLDKISGVVLDSNRTALLHLLHLVTPHNDIDNTLEEFEERAAIMEYDGGLSREDAEKQALTNLIYIRSNNYDQ